MSNFTFLTEEQYFGSDKLDILEKRGTKAALTDFSILLGAYASDDYHINNDKSLEGRTGAYWTKSDDGDKDTCAIENCGNVCSYMVIGRSCGVRLALPFSSIYRILTNGESGKYANDGVFEVEYGYYPQKAVSRDMQEKLEKAYKSGSMLRTGNSYTTDSKNMTIIAKNF